MKRVLIVTRLYYRRNVRVERLARYLVEFGWRPIILTPALLENPDPQLTIIETPYRHVLDFWRRLFRFNPDEDIRKQIKNRFKVTSKKSPVDFLLTLGGGIIYYPCPDKNWKPFAIKAASEILQREGINAVISSSPPVISHIIAGELKAEYKIPWLADFRDLWSQNHNYIYGPVRKFFDTRLELKTLSIADALVTVSHPLAEKLAALHKGKSVYAITHGFDPAEVNDPPANLTAKFTITYTGSIYATKQDPSRLLAALSDLTSDGTIDPAEVEVRFYGLELGWLAREVEEYGLSGVVRQYRRVPRQIALERQRESQLLLLLKWEDPQERGTYTGKVFEYLAARRPVLATGGSNDVIDELLDKTKAGICTPTVEDIKNMLKQLYQEYKLKGEVAYQGVESEINKYSHREMASKFAGILGNLVRK